MNFKVNSLLKNLLYLNFPIKLILNLIIIHHYSLINYIFINDFLVKQSC